MEKKKSNKEASELFHNIMKASVTPKIDIDKTLNHISEEIKMVVPDWDEFTLLQGNDKIPALLLEFSHDCPKEKEEQIRKIIKHNADLIGVKVQGL